jgi:hypothetical protein
MSLERVTVLEYPAEMVRSSKDAPQFDGSTFLAAWDDDFATAATVGAVQQFEGYRFTGGASDEEFARVMRENMVPRWTVRGGEKLFVTEVAERLAAVRRELENPREDKAAPVDGSPELLSALNLAEVKNDDGSKAAKPGEVKPAGLTPDKKSR